MMDYTMANYRWMDNRAEEIEAELDELRKLKYAMDDEDEAEELYGEEISDLEAELENLRGEMGEMDEHWLLQDYYASVL